MSNNALRLLNSEAKFLGSRIQVENEIISASEQSFRKRLENGHRQPATSWHGRYAPRRLGSRNAVASAPMIEDVATYPGWLNWSANRRHRWRVTAASLEGIRKRLRRWLTCTCDTHSWRIDFETLVNGSLRMTRRRWSAIFDPFAIAPFLAQPEISMCLAPAKVANVTTIGRLQLGLTGCLYAHP